MINKKPIHSRTAEEAKASADRNWEVIKEKFLKGECTSQDLAAAMRWCNSIEVEQVHRDMADYLQKRREWLIDPDTSSGDKETDENYVRLRNQYQEIYGKDVKHK